MSECKIWYYYVGYDGGNFMGHCLSSHASKHQVVADVIDKAERDLGKSLNVLNYYAYTLEISALDDEGLAIVQGMIDNEKELRGQL